ncbi:hypothetical protein [Streptomyces cyaneofuscatus]|uniref:hypothetical protein n=1 Tax=Streptomyces cyaneofuscatus TaxID=66883 RepID=UPI0034295C87
MTFRAWPRACTGANAVRAGFGPHAPVGWAARSMLRHLSARLAAHPYWTARSGRTFALIAIAHAVMETGYDLDHIRASIEEHE